MTGLGHSKPKERMIELVVYRGKSGSMSRMNAIVWYLLAAMGEIAGCFSFWAWLRMGKSVAWTLPGTCALVGFALCLTRIESEAAGRAYAAYGGIYIVSSVAWLWIVEGVRPDRWDLVGTAVCVCGAALILYAPRPAAGTAARPDRLMTQPASIDQKNGIHDE